MKIKIAFSVLLTVLCLSLSGGPTSYDTRWQKVISGIENYLPETAAKELDTIESLAIAEGNQTQLLRAVLFRQEIMMVTDDKPVAYQSFIRYAEPKTNLFDSVYAAILHTEIARCYVDYYYSKEQKIKRNPYIEGDLADTEIITWGKQNVKEVVGRHLEAAQQPLQKLKQTATADFFDIIADMNLPEGNFSYEPTLFDFVFHRSANFYKTFVYDEDTQPEWNTSDWWLPDVDFVKAELPESDNTVIKCLKTYQTIIANRLENGLEEVLIYNDLSRFDFVNSILRDDKAYMYALEDLFNRHSQSSLSAEIANAIASCLSKKVSNIEKDFKHAERYFLDDDRRNDDYTPETDSLSRIAEICHQLVAKYPNDVLVTSRCIEILDFIYATDLSVKLNPVQLPDENIPLVLRYRNADHIYLKLVKIDKTDKLNKTKKKPAFFENRIDLPAENDFNPHSTLVSLPPLPRGRYHLFVSTRNNFLTDKNVLGVYFQVSDLGYFIDDNKDIITTVSRKTGKPLSDVTVCISKERRYGGYDIRIKRKSDKHGRLKKPSVWSSSNKIEELYCNGDTLFNTRGYYYSWHQPNHFRLEMKIFTDRSIYRPGQTVHFHGVVVEIHNNETVPKANIKEEIVFYDSNGKEIDRMEVCSDEYGSFNSSFEIPTDLLNGIFSIGTDWYSDFCEIQVEEYKRPTFEINFEKPKEQYKIGQTITLNGDVSAFAGFGLDNVECQYIVKRKTSFPWQSTGQSYPYVEDSQEAQGDFKTDSEGKFSLDIELKPAEKIKPEQQPLFTFEIEVKATDAQGETHSKTFTLCAGYRETAITAKIPYIIEKSDIEKGRIDMVNMSGESVKGRLTQKIFHLDEAARVNYFEAMGYNAAPLDRKIHTDRELDSLFPNYSFYPEKRKTLISETVINIDGETNFEAAKYLESGKYLLELVNLEDTLVRMTKQFTIYDNSSSQMPVKAMSWLQADKEEAHPGDTIRFSIGSSAKDIELTVNLYHNNNEKRIDTLLNISESATTLTYVVKEKDRGILCFVAAFAKNNSFNNPSVNIFVPFDNLDLDVELTSVRDNLTPGKDETWELSVSDRKGNPQKSALLTGMYDTSLDAFKMHYWPLFRMEPGNIPAAQAFGSSSNYFNGDSHNVSFRQTYVNYAIAFNISLPSDAPFFDAVMVKNYPKIYKDDGTSSILKTSKNIGLLKGVVKDEEDEPVPFANVFLEKDGVMVDAAQTDFDGNYLIEAITPGVYDLKASYVGYNMFILKGLVIPAKKITYYDIKMTSGNIELNEVCCIDYEGPRSSYDRSTRGKHPSRSYDDGVFSSDGGVFSSDGEVGSIRGARESSSYYIDGVKVENPEMPVTSSDDYANIAVGESFLIPARKNFNETAFFEYLKTDENGKATLKFTTPDALSRWRMMTLAYTKDSKTGYKEYNFTTSKPVMIMADMPRYLYDSDTIWLVANVINKSSETINPKARLEILDAVTLEPVGHPLSEAIQNVGEILAGQSKKASWKIAVKGEPNLLTFRFTAVDKSSGDAEQHTIPILSSDIFMIQNLPLTVPADTVITFNLDSIAINKDDERLHNLALNFSTNPVWYAVQPLPYMSNISMYCAENAFYVFYANTLSAYISDNLPKLMAYIRKWKTDTPDALMSKLNQDESLKAIMLQETPWVLDAQSEPEQRSRIAILFDAIKLPMQQAHALKVMTKNQQDSGGWSWMDGMPESPFITTRILAGFGKLKNIGALASLNQTNKVKTNQLTDKAVMFLEKTVADDFRTIKSHRTDKPIEAMTVEELYALSFFDQQDSDKDFAEAKKYFLHKLSNDWKEFSFNLRSKAALVLHRSGDTKTAKLILQSLKEFANKDERAGMFWDKKYFSFDSHIATHANIMAAFAEIENDNETLDQLRVWLLTQKQTNMWENSASTAEAVYALLMRGSDWLHDSKPVTLSFADQKIDTDDAVAGTGFIQRNWTAAEITPKMHSLTVNNPTAHLVWGGLFRQYFVPIDKVKADTATFKIKRELFIENNTDKGVALTPIEKCQPKVGDKIVVRLTFEASQDMSFVFVKDLRAAGFEPLEQISSYRYNDGMSYYYSITDTFTGFYIDFLSKGIHHLEYEMYITKEGNLSNGYALIQCLYAPEFTSYSSGMRINVKNN